LTAVPPRARAARPRRPQLRRDSRVVARATEPRTDRVRAAEPGAGSRRPKRPARPGPPITATRMRPRPAMATGVAPATEDRGREELDSVLMRRALAAARAAGRLGEVPIGAAASHDGRVIAVASNRMERSGDATAHAEMLVLRRAARVLGGWRLGGVTLAVTLEPCPMCAGAMLQARIARCVFGATDP